MSEQLPQDVTPTMQELMAQMARMQTQLDSLKERAKALSQVEEPVNTNPAPALTSTRRKTLKRLGLALLGGAATATALGVQTTQAKITANPTLSGSTSKAGAIITPPGAAAPTGTAPTGHLYGLVGSGDTTSLDLSNLPDNSCGFTGTSSGYGVYGFGSYGVYGSGSTGVLGNGRMTGVFGFGTNGVIGNGNTGVYGSGNYVGVIANGLSSITNSLRSNVIIGAIAVADLSLDLSTFSDNFRIGLYANAGNPGGGVTSRAAVLAGNVDVYGLLTKGGGSFKIDHPLDPENKYLYHSFVESPDMKNIYDGVVTLDNQGEAVVTLPIWFEALNSDYRYQLTCLGEFAPVFVSQKLTKGQFKIAVVRRGKKLAGRSPVFGKTNGLMLTASPWKRIKEQR